MAEDLPVFVGYRQQHPALILGYWEPFRQSGASQLVLGAVHRVARAQRRRESKIIRLASSIRGLLECPEIMNSDVFARAAAGLDRTWRSVVRGRAQVTEDLLADLETAHMYVKLLARWGPRPDEAGLVDSVVDQLRRDVAELLGREPEDVSGTADSI